MSSIPAARSDSRNALSHWRFVTVCAGASAGNGWKRGRSEGARDVSAFLALASCSFTARRVVDRAAAFSWKICCSPASCACRASELLRVALTVAREAAGSNAASFSICAMQSSKVSALRARSCPIWESREPAKASAAAVKKNSSVVFMAALPGSLRRRACDPSRGPRCEKSRARSLRRVWREAMPRCQGIAARFLRAARHPLPA